MIFNLPRDDTARYMAIDNHDCGVRHHVELFTPLRLSPDRRNTCIWAAHDLREVCCGALFL